MKCNKDKIIKDISIDEAIFCKDKVYAKDIYYRFCINKNCECVWSQYETVYLLPYFDELKKNEREIRESFLENIRNK
jgi:hypothetical protein